MSSSLQGQALLVSC